VYRAGNGSSIPGIDPNVRLSDTSVKFAILQIDVKNGLLLYHSPVLWAGVSFFPQRFSDAEGWPQIRYTLAPKGGQS
jgi:hypothetical protein